MPDLKVSNMHINAARIVARARDTTSGTFVIVGWDGSSISAGDKIRKGLPHLRIDIAKTDSEEGVETKLAMAVLELRRVLPAALAKWRTPPPPRSQNHPLAKKGLYAGRSKR